MSGTDAALACIFTGSDCRNARNLLPCYPRSPDDRSSGVAKRACQDPAGTPAQGDRLLELQTEARCCDHRLRTAGDAEAAEDFRNMDLDRALGEA